MNWHDHLSQRLDRIEASTRRIKAHWLRFLAQHTGQTEAQVWAGLVLNRDRQQAATS